MAEPRFRLTERHVLLWIFVGFVIAYGGTFLVVALSGRTPRPETESRPTVRWMNPQPSANPRYRAAEMMDPSLMSLPNLNGYSRGLWKRGATAQHRVWEPGVELAYLAESTPGEIGTLLAQPAVADAVRWSVDKPVSPPDVAGEIASVAVAQAQTQSVFRIENGLATRVLTRPPELPVITSETPLRPSVVRIGVSAEGSVRYAILQRSSGQESADQTALAVARGLEFEPNSGPGTVEVSWGLVRFLWLTALPARVTTNNAVTSLPR